MFIFKSSAVLSPIMILCFFFTYLTIDSLILEDIIDSGSTLKMICEMFRERKPASIKICTLLDKPTGRKVDLKPDYTCFTVPPAFVVGFGLDYEDYYRNLPFVGVLKPSVYQDQ